MATIAKPGFIAKLFIKPDNETVYKEVAEIRQLTLFVQTGFVDKTTFASDGWREKALSKKGWSAAAAYNYLDPKVDHKDLRNFILSTPKEFFIKITPEPDFDSVTKKRQVFRGLCLLKTHTTQAPNSDKASVSVVIVGKSPLDEDEETLEQFNSGQDCYCVEFHQTVYLTLNQTFQFP